MGIGPGPPVAGGGWEGRGGSKPWALWPSLGCRAWPDLPAPPRARCEQGPDVRARALLSHARPSGEQLGEPWRGGHWRPLSSGDPPPRPLGQGAAVAVLGKAALVSLPARAPHSACKLPPLWSGVSPHLLCDRPKPQSQPSHPLCPGGVTSSQRGRGFRVALAAASSSWSLGSLGQCPWATWEPAPQASAWGHPCSAHGQAWGRGPRPSEHCQSVRSPLTRGPGKS